MECGDVVDLTPPAGKDLSALRTTLFEGGEDDEGTDPQVLISNIKICAREEREAGAPKVKMKDTS